jgi:hypothetical protein
LRKIGLSLVLLIVALIAWEMQPWRFVYAGYARGDVAVAGGTLRFDLVDHAGKKRRGHCLSYYFTTPDPEGDAITVTLERIGTRSQPDLRRDVQARGTTAAAPLPDAPRYFPGPNIGQLEFPFDEPLEITGSVQYKGVNHPFRTALQLQRWHKGLRVTSFCVG